MARGRRRRRKEPTIAERLDEISKEASELGLVVVIGPPAGSAADVPWHQLPVPAPGKEYTPPVVDERVPKKDKYYKAVEKAMAAFTKREAEAMLTTMTETELARMHALLEKLRPAMAGKRFWWEADLEKIDLADLSEFNWAVNRLTEKIRQGAPPPPRPIRS